MVESGYAMVAKIRGRELFTRLALAAFIGVTAWFITHSPWVGWWLLAVAVTQVVDWAVFRRLRVRPDLRPGRSYAALCCASAALTVVAYSAISVLLWFQGGESGRLFAMVQVAGGLLHVSLHMHHVRALMVSAAAPHGLYFLGLPVVQAVVERAFGPLLIGVAALLYLAHLAAAVRQNNRTSGELRLARLQAERERRRAEAAFEARSDLMAVISHEIRTSMNGVITATNLLRRTRLDRDQREHVGILMDAGDMLMGLLNDVLDFSKIEAGRMRLDITDVSLDDKLNALRRVWEPKALAGGVRLRVEIEETAPEALRADPLRFQQILFNLVSNAVKFTEAGEIVISARRSGDDRLSIAVRDTGRGIPPDRLARVFDRFEQAGASTARHYGGTGLGLAISRKLAELMGGDLTAESTVGRGSTFTLSLPVEAVAEARSEEAAIEAVDLTGLRVLAADDHEVNRRILGLLLEPLGCRLTLTEHGEAAAAAAAVEPFDLILLDMQMPVMDGLEALRRIRAGGVNAATPVAALTAHAGEDHREAWSVLGAHAFLTKPIDPQALVEVLSDARVSGRGHAPDGRATAAA